MIYDLPKSVSIGDSEYEIRYNYKAILDICTALTDPDLSDQEHAYAALVIFYPDFDSISPKDYKEALEKCYWFINCGEAEKHDGSPPLRLIDWEQDFPMIISDVNKVAGCEVRALTDCHWWTFISWFTAIGEGRLSTVVGIRNKLARHKKLEKWEQEYYRENKSQVQLAKHYSQAELDEQERIKKLLGE